VRETCAQVLGVTTVHLDPELVYNIAQRIVQFVTRPEWEVRHGGLLGLKYILAARRVRFKHYRANRVATRIEVNWLNAAVLTNLKLGEQRDHRLHVACAMHSRHPLPAYKRCSLPSTCRRRTDPRT